MIPLAKKFFNSNVLIILSILALAFFFRVWNISTEEIQGDEGSYALRGIGWNDFMQSGTLTTPWNWFISEKKLPFWTQLSFNDHPPLHFAAIWLSSNIFGISLWALRLPSVLFGVGAIFLLIASLQKLHYKIGSYIGGYLLAILPWHIYISRHAGQESQVIFWISAVIFFLTLLKTTEKKMLYWSLAIASFSLGMMTKYSMIVIFPLLLYVFIKEKFYKNITFYAAFLLIPIILSPVIIYNAKVYALRGHFDLQISRFLKMDTEIDWIASRQGIWQGNIASFLDYFKNISSWMSIPLFILLLAGVFFLWKKIDECIFSYGMLILVAVFSVLTLPDFFRSSIIIPFIVLGISFSQDKILKKYFSFSFVILLAGFFLLFSHALSERLSVKIFPDNIMYSFEKEILGFQKLEEWLAQKGVSDRPIRYASFIDWAQHFLDQIRESPFIIIYDQRFIWWQANWYLYRQSFYSEKIPVIHSSFFQVIREDAETLLKNKEVYFIEVGDRTKDIKGEFDPSSRMLADTLTKYFIEQKVVPETIRDSRGLMIFRVWKFVWN